MEIVNDRLVNGLLKGFKGVVVPDAIEGQLARDIEIVAPAERAVVNDLWPGIWALAAVLERQTRGRVLIRCGLDRPLACPSPLGSRCQFTQNAADVALSIAIGADADPSGRRLCGDARIGRISMGEFLGEDLPAPTAIECFALAGYLGFSAIALLVGVPQYRSEYARPALGVPYDRSVLSSRLEGLDGITSMGLGQLGQAFLALLFFLYSGDFRGRRLALIDHDSFEAHNGRTQLLLPEGGDWDGKRKAPFIAALVESWNAAARDYPEELVWGWSRALEHPPLGLVGLHDFEGRRIACAAGFERLLEAGVGTDLMRPRVTWHFLPGKAELGKRLFPDVQASPVDMSEASWTDTLKKTPGGCGWVRFLNVSATAPCLGVSAVAFAIAELGRSSHVPRRGSAVLWSPCLPLFGETVVL